MEDSYKSYIMKHSTKSCIILVALLWLTTNVCADTPANCTMQDVVGDWIFEETAKTHDNTVDCDKITSRVRASRIRLESPDVAVDEFGNHGHWTMVYNQGFEVTVNERSYFAFSDYDITDDGDVVSYCNRTTPGWAHDVTLRHWSCFSASKVSSDSAVKVHKVPKIYGRELVVPEEEHRMLVDEVNSVQTSWRAELHEPFLGLTRGQLFNMRGGEKSWLPYRPEPAPVSEELKTAAAQLPSHLDWRNVSGINYVSPVKQQGGCSSCYIFATTAMLESRLRIRTNNTAEVLLSEQEVVTCNELAQGCMGGFPYLVSRYAMGHGMVESSCYPEYNGIDGPCQKNSCDRQFVARYRYIGGYFGGCNEEGMLVALLGGPIVVNIMAYRDLDGYKTGVYHLVAKEKPENLYPYHVVNHSVLVVGYGVNETSGEKYWIVKNSWGATWGNKGYFLMRRGTNECGIESLASDADPIPW